LSPSSDDGSLEPIDGAGIASDAMLDPNDAAAPPPARVLYAEGAIQSPITQDMALALRSRAQQIARQDRVFAKVGDSITAATSFLNCFDASSVDLGSNGALSTTLAYFRAGNAAVSSPFSRFSASARNGWTTADELTGSPTPLQTEVAATSPHYALVMLGTNDLRFARPYDSADGDLWTIVDELLAAGVIPILSTIPANYDDSSANARVALYNRFVRAIAQGRGVPLVDYHLAMHPLPNEGISSDGIHPTVSPQGACVLDDGGLAYGYNLRNLLSLDALDRTRRAVAGEAMDGEMPRRLGAGSHSDPYRGDLPLIDLADTRSGEAALASYCGLTGGGHEIIYRIDLAAGRSISATIVDRGAVEVDVAIMEGSLDPSACRAVGDRAASATVAAGPVFIVVDSRTATTEGEFLLVVQ
jgi:lysophospholipase L1-like esterase